MEELSKYAIFDGQLLTRVSIIKSVSSGNPVVLCINEAGEQGYANFEEWKEGSERFTTHSKQELFVTSESSASAKLHLFRSLFQGREDVFGHGYWNKKTQRIGYSPACANERFYDVCPRWKTKGFRCTNCEVRKLLPLTDHALVQHFKGLDSEFRDVVGIYLLRSDGTVSTLTVDFDKGDWQNAVNAFREAGRKLGIDVAVERSRSGNGAHAWLFFEKPITGSKARDFGSVLLTRAMEISPAVAFDSYDRMFPAQATIPEGGFGNLIALPFQGAALRKENSVFVDEDFDPFADQWLFLSRLRKIPIDKVEYVIGSCQGGPLGELTYDRQGAKEAQMKAKPWQKPVPVTLDARDFPEKVVITRADMLYISEEGLSSAARNRLLRLASFGNPEFYRAQAMHQSVYGKPRIICLAEERKGYLSLHRGVEEKLENLLRDLNVPYRFEDHRYNGKTIDVAFRGQLRKQQDEAVNVLLEYDTGILSAPTGFGKTVIGAALIAHVKLPCLVIVPKTALVDQWKERLAYFLDIREELPPLLTPTGRESCKKRSLVGQVGAGGTTKSGIIDVATYQSLLRKDENGRNQVKELVKEYGLVIVDECQHGAAPQLESVLKAVNPQRIYGLSATPKRADGLESITFLLCGPIRLKIDPLEQAQMHGYRRLLRPRFTGIRLPDVERGASFTQILEQLCAHKKRNALIVEDVKFALEHGRIALVISKRKDHARLLHRMLVDVGCDARLVVGEGTPKQRKDAIKKAKLIDEDQTACLVATESYLGEGFDMPNLNALFFATPVSWAGNVMQQSGRLHREFEGKTEVVVYDYIDTSVPMLERMYKKRLKTYTKLGYEVKTEEGTAKEASGVFVNRDEWIMRLKTDVLNSKRSVRVFASYANEGAIRELESVLKSAVDRGVEIYCMVPETDFKKASDMRTSSALVRLRSIGCNVVKLADAPSGLAIIDEKLIWYGSLPLLAFPRSDEASLRLEDAELAGEILGSLI